jgi:hypothetical protein
MLDKQNEALTRGLRRLVQWYFNLPWPWKVFWMVAFLLLWVWVECPAAIPYLCAELSAVMARPLTLTRTQNSPFLPSSCLILTSS